MMKHILLLLFSVNVFAQVGINTTAPSNASALHVSSSSNNVNFGGFLPPKVTLAQRNAIPVTPADDGMLIYLQNASQRCLQIYDATESQWQNVYCMPINQAPIASNVTVSGTLTDGQALTGTFTYSDNESNAAGTHAYKWYRANSAAGAGAVAIAGATGTTYTLTPADIGKFIAFEVTPAATAGATPGIATLSTYSGPILAKPTIISFVQLNQSKNENASPNTITLRLSFPNVSTSAVSVTIASSSYTRLTQTGPQTIVIPAGQTSPYNVAVFNVINNTLIDGNANLTFTITNVTGGSGANSVGSPSTDTCTIINDDNSLVFTETFTSYAGSGFAPAPAAGQLDSDFWRTIVDTQQMAWSGTYNTGVHARGTNAGTATIDGVYAFLTGGGNRALGIKGSGDLFTGGIVLRIRNTTGATLNNWQINYSLWRYNTSAAGTYTFGLGYSASDGSYTNIISTGNSTNTTLNTWVQANYTPSIILSVPPNGYIYLYWQASNDQAYQYGDPFAIDNITITGTP